VTTFTELMEAAAAAGITFTLLDDGQVKVTRPETSEAADLVSRLRPHKDDIVAALVAAALTPASAPPHCLVRGCDNRDVREYQTPTGPEVYCERHARMLIWDEHVKKEDE